MATYREIEREEAIALFLLGVPIEWDCSGEEGYTPKENRWFPLEPDKRGVDRAAFSDNAGVVDFYRVEVDG